MADTSKRGQTPTHPRPALTADIVLCTVCDDALHVLLIQRKAEPHQGAWALPGGFVEEMEALEQAAARELQEETGVDGIALRQCGVSVLPAATRAAGPSPSALWA